MSDGKKYYCFCGSNCKYETMTKEQILAAIAQAVSTGSVGDVDTGFITKVKETNGGKAVTFWVGTQAQYNAIANKAENCMYIITDDTSSAELKESVEQIAQDVRQQTIYCGQAAQAANDTAFYAKAFDVTDKVALSVRGSLPAGLVSFDIHKAKFLYSPSLGIVFFEIDITYAADNLAANEFVYLDINKYKSSTNFPYSWSKRFYTENGRWMASMWNGKGFQLYNVNPLSDPEFPDSITFDGWYFCDGEG